MKRFLTLALVAGIIAAVPTSASASPYLSMSKAKSYARGHARTIADGYDSWLGGCSRQSSSRIICRAYSDGDNMTCTFLVGERMTYYGQVLFFNPHPSNTRCY
jgi:hypothetical protein